MLEWVAISSSRHYVVDPSLTSWLSASFMLEAWPGLQWKWTVVITLSRLRDRAALPAQSHLPRKGERLERPDF